MIEDRVLGFGGQVSSELEGSSEEKWLRLNEVLAKMQIERCDLQYTSQGGDGFVGPSENSLLKAYYLLI